MIENVRSAYSEFLLVIFPTSYAAIVRVPHVNHFRAFKPEKCHGLGTAMRGDGWGAVMKRQVEKNVT